jgi:peroxiredoxin
LNVNNEYKQADKGTKIFIMNVEEFKQVMRFFLFAMIISILVFSCTSKSGITGTFSGLTNDTLWIQVSVLNDEYRIKHNRTDTVIVRDGKFFYDPQTNNLTELRIMPIENINRSPNSSMISFGPGATMVLLYFPDDYIRLDADNEDQIIAFQAKGNRYNEQLSTINTNTLAAYKQRNDALRRMSTDRTVYQEQLREALRIITNNELNYICNNSDEPLSAYLVSSWIYQFSDRTLQYADSLGDVAMNSEPGRILRRKIEDIYLSKVSEEESMKKGIAREEMIGRPAPEFMLKDINGNDFSLSTLRGKYVILDFWGSWCWGCLESFPNMKKYYAAHPDEFEIVGIAFSDKMEAWRKVVLEKHNLPWINVFDDDNISDKYYVTFAPTYFLIDKEGVILDLGYDEAIKQLNELREKRLL